MNSNFFCDLDKVFLVYGYFSTFAAHNEFNNSFQYKSTLFIYFSKRAIMFCVHNSFYHWNSFGLENISAPLFKSAISLVIILIHLSIVSTSLHSTITCVSSDFLAVSECNLSNSKHILHPSSLQLYGRAASLFI